MKKIFYFAILAISLVCSCSPDDANDSNVDTDVNTDVNTDVDNGANAIRFPMAEVVDLGLSVHWASWNIGETSEFSTGMIYVWGDADGTKPYGTSLDECPCAFPPSNISGTEYDIATKQWGDDWRIPLDKEFAELWSNSTVTVGEVNQTQYYKFTSKINGNSIYLPATSDYLYTSCYWTGDLYSTDTRRAVTNYIDVKESKPRQIWIDLERNNKCCIRPVFEHTKAWTYDAINIKSYSATLKGSLSHNAINKSEDMGFYISTNSADIENPSRNARKIPTSHDDGEISVEVSDLTRNQEYYYRTYAKFNGKEYLGEVRQFVTLNAYSVGELWPSEENPEGVVFKINNNGTHGMIVSLDQTSLVWQGGIATFVAANDFDDGRNNVFPSSSLVAQWVAGHGDGWYCPAKNELHSLSSAVKKVNETLRQKGLSSLDNFYWSSTQYSVNYYDMAYMVVVTGNSSYMGYSNGYSTYNSKSNARGVVAIKRF